ncbi:MAG: HlyD family efflux transporter periplasmic adaptor subunit [Terrimonas sp.]|nr:HlyD family efflux transporter periplasmic adaptor subunit [Terrimonas sp.]
MKKIIASYLLPLLVITGPMIGCSSPESTAAADVPVTVTPVTVTGISHEPMTNSFELNATSAYLQKWSVKSNVNGYIQTTQAQLNKTVHAGQVLFTIKTKEATSIGSVINDLDSSLRFTGTNSITAAAGGFLSEINHQAGDYVLDGEQLATITDTRSFVFLLNLPYELRPYLLNRKDLELVLPDGEQLPCSIQGMMPAMDSATQTQRIILKVNPSHPIPENLIAKVRVTQALKEHPVSLPKSAVLTNETQDEFWVMKMTDSTTAVKVPVRIGLENNDRVEILTPPFSDADRIVLTGNYGLPDTAKVKIVQ